LYQINEKQKEKIFINNHPPFEDDLSYSPSALLDYPAFPVVILYTCLIQICSKVLLYTFYL